PRRALRRHSRPRPRRGRQGARGDPGAGQRAAVRRAFPRGRRRPDAGEERGGMIRYALVCEAAHAFEGWFGRSADFDAQAAQGLLECPACGSRSVRKQIMAPAVAGAIKRGDGAPEGRRQMMMEAMAQVRRHVEDNFDYVGDAFAREARAIHEGKSEDRGIYGEATPAEVKKLVDDGVPVAPLPPEPAKKSEVN